MSHPQEKEPLAGEAEGGQVQYVAATPQQAEAVYIHSVSSVRYEEYKGRCSIIAGILLIILQTISIVINIAGLILQPRRNSPPGFWIKGNVFYYLFSAVWSCLFVYVCGALAIAAGKLKKRGLIIAHLVLACIASPFAGAQLAISVGALISDAEDKMVDKLDKVSLGLSILWFLLCLAIFIMVIWGAALCCKVLCCGRIKSVSSLEVVTPLPGIQDTIVLHTDNTDKTSPASS